MLEIICAIPDVVGWTAVGILCVVDLIALHMVGSTIYRAIKERREEA